MEVNNKRADHSISSQVTSLYFITSDITLFHHPGRHGRRSPQPKNTPSSSWI